MILREGLYFPDSDTHCSPSVLEPSHFSACLKYINNFRTAIDCGGHVGVWSVLMSEKFNSVISFEPSKDNYWCLFENTKNILNVKPINAALGSKKMSGSLHPPVNPGNSGSAWVVSGNDFEIIRIDDLNLKDVDYIKMDVEGCEPFVIDGAIETIKVFSPVILVEQKQITARYGIDYMEAGKILENIGYSMKEKLNNDYIYAK